MKKPIYILLLICICALQTKAQDKIKLRNGSIIEVQIKQSLGDKVEYSYPNKNGIYERPKSAISYIEYENGEIEYCDENAQRQERATSTNRATATNSNIRRKRIIDDENNYDDTNYDEEPQSTIYLKNGRTIKGNIIKENDREVKIETEDGILTISTQRIKSISKAYQSSQQSYNQQRRVSTRDRYDDDDDYYDDNGNRSSYNRNTQRNSIARFSGYIQFFGVGYQNDFDDAAYWESKASFGCRFVDRFYIGGGFGINPFYDNTSEFNLVIPVFATARVNFTKTRVSPYFQLDLGYKIQAHNDYDAYKNNFFMNPTIGLDFNLGTARRKALFLSLSLVEYGKIVKDYYYNIVVEGNHVWYEYYYNLDNGFYVKAGLNFGLRF